MALNALSKKRLATCHPDLVRVITLAASRIPVLVTCGHRGEIDQRHAFINGFSKADWPDSPHNETPSRAVDLAPLPLDWTDIAAFERMAKVVLMAADELGVALRWGGHFKRFVDRPHFELA
jgi:peptidoglycan L-alanyl-D-glutamate endopeptidase CwlK